MTDTNATNPSSSGLDLHHRFGVAIDGLYKGAINALSMPGYIADGINNAPRIFGYEKISEHPFMGSESIHNGLSSAYKAYNNFLGVKPPERIDLTDKAIGFIAEEAPSVAVGGAALKIASSTVTGAKVATEVAQIAQSPAVGSTISNGSGLLGRLGRGSLSAAWSIAKHPIRTAQAAVGVTTTAAVADLAVNDGNITGWGIRKLFNKAVSAVTGDSDIASAWDNNAPEGLKQFGDSFMGFAKDNPGIAKWGSFALGMLGGNAVFGKIFSSILGDNPLAALLALAVAALAAWKMSDSFSAAAQGYTPRAGITPAPENKTVRNNNFPLPAPM
jgi:hypothetical protein